MPLDRRPAAIPSVFRVAPNGCRHRAGSRDAAQANAVRVLLACEAANERRAAVAALDLPAGTHMAERMERHAADVAQARAAERARVAAIEHGETIRPKPEIWVDLPVE